MNEEQAMAKLCSELEWVVLPGGTYLAGSDDFYPDEAPAHTQTVTSFALTRTPITNQQFFEFVEETAYVTVAERPVPASAFPQLSESERSPGSLVFTPTRGPVALSDWRQWWCWVPGANWRHPGGPETDIQEKANHPVVQIAQPDAAAYAAWAGGRLPTESELEFAACGGETPSPFAWGSARNPSGEVLANTWYGKFPYRNEGARGWVGTSPVGAFPANGYGLCDCIGNVWEWTSTLYAPNRSELLPATERDRCACGPSSAGSHDGNTNPQAGMPEFVLKGGSHLCAPEYCLRYRPAARSPQAGDSATTHIGFRIARSP